MTHQIMTPERLAEIRDRIAFCERYYKELDPQQALELFAEVERLREENAVLRQRLEGLEK